MKIFTLRFTLLMVVSSLISCRQDTSHATKSLNISFTDFITNFKETKLPIFLFARKNWGVESNSALLIDSNAVSQFLCLEQNTDSCWTTNGGSSNYYYVSRFTTNNKEVINLIYYVSFNNGHKYMLNTYNKSGSKISSFELSSLNGDKYEQDVEITTDLKIKITKMILLAFDNKEEIQTATIENSIFQINSKGNITFLGSNISEPKKFRFTDNNYEPLEK